METYSSIAVPCDFPLHAIQACHFPVKIVFDLMIPDKANQHGMMMVDIANNICSTYAGGCGLSQSPSRTCLASPYKVSF
jgi:hypothetical protein